MVAVHTVVPSFTRAHRRHPAINPRGGLTLPSIEGRIELRDVTFRYPSSQDQRALDSVNLVIEPGAHVVICGPAGCGKTTVLSVIERFFDPQVCLSVCVRLCACASACVQIAILVAVRCGKTDELTIKR